MKKRLFITTALMTAVLGCSLTTGTYAWYKVDKGNATLAATQTGTVHANTAYSGFGDLEFTLALNVNEGEPVDLTDASGDTYVMTTLTEKQQVPASRPVSSLCSCTVTYNNGVMDTAEKLAPFAGTYVVTLTPSEHVRIVAKANKVSCYSQTAGQTLTFNLVISDKGVISYSNDASNGVYEFYYTLEPTSETAEETARTDTIQASMAMQKQM